MLSEANRRALLMELHRLIEGNAVRSIKAVTGNDVAGAISYPPNAVLTDAEEKALRQVEFDDALTSALRKLLMANAADVTFSLFSLLDGVTEPFETSESWTSASLVDKSAANVSSDFLHDDFMETYWDWYEERSRKN